MPEVGLIITAEDKAGSVLSAIGNVGKSSLDKLRKAGEGAGNAMKIAGASIAVFNQALEIGKKGIDIFRALIVENVRAMVEYRGETDKIAKKFKEIGEEAQFTRAVITDLLTPAILGLADAYSEAGSVIVDYINTNRRLIATNIVEFLTDTAEVLIKGVSVGLLWASRGFSGLLIVVNAVAAAFNVLASTWLDGLKMMLSAIAEVQDFLGNDAMAKSLRSTATEVQALSDLFASSAVDNINSIETTIEAQKKFEEGIAKVREIALTFTGEARASMLAWADSWKPVKRKARETVEVIGEVKTGVKDMDATLATSTQAWQSFASIAGTSMVNLAAQQENASDVIKKAGFSTLKTLVRFAMAEAAAKAIAAHMNIPFAGVAIGLSFAAAAVAAIESAVGGASFATGGMVEGPAGVDNLNIRASRKERVLSARQTESFERLVEWVTAQPSAVGAGAGAGGGTVINQYDQRSVVPRRGVDMQKASIALDKTNKKLQRRGRLGK